MVVKFYSPVLNGFRLFLAAGCSFSEAKKSIQKYVIYELNDSDAVGRTIEIDKGTVLVWIDTKYLTSVREAGLWRCPSVVCHEGLHAALRAAEWINAHNPQDAEEPLAYLLSTYGMMWEVLNLKLRKGKLSSGERRWLSATIDNFHFEIFE